MLMKDIGIRKRALGLWLKGNTFTQVALAMGLSRQRVHELLTPPPVLRRVTYTLARGECEECGVLVGRNGHYHSEPGDDYDDFTKPLTLLCLACHRTKHIRIYLSKYHQLDIHGNVYPLPDLSGGEPISE